MKGRREVPIRLVTGRPDCGMNRLMVAAFYAFFLNDDLREAILAELPPVTASAVLGCSGRR